MTTIRAPTSGTQNINSKRWRYLSLGVLCMLMLANMQYAWTLFVHPLHQAHGWDIAAIQLAFTAFVALETWGTPVAGWIADKLPPSLAPRIVIGVGGVLVAIGWSILSWAESLHMLYLGGALTGIGTGAAYTTCVGLAAKWFKDRRGLAVGLIAAGYGTGTVLTVIPIRMVIAAYGYQSAFLWVGLLAGAVVLVASQFMREPRPGEAPEPDAVTASREICQSFSPSQVLRKPVFWVLYLADVMMCAGGLAVAASLALMAQSFGVTNSVGLPHCRRG
jgi:OFA family oxalate/formate antiporter-like MFS transporter